MLVYIYIYINPVFMYLLRYNRFILGAHQFIKVYIIVMEKGGI